MSIAKPTGMASLEYFQGLRIQDRHSGQSGAQTRSPEQRSSLRCPSIMPGCGAGVNVEKDKVGW